jgi:cation:H+ antiporter
MGLLLLASLIMYIIYLIKYDTRKDSEEIIEENLSLSKSIFIFISGLIGVSLGANLLIEGSIDLANYFGIRETVIGLGVLAFGTSLPEVATSIIAAIKKENNIAIGNIVGSNIFNILGIGGVTILISGNDFLNINNTITIFDIIPFLLSTIVLVYFYKFNTNINRLHGIIFVIFYLIWIFYIFLN